jgi:serine protease Do
MSHFRTPPAAKPNLTLALLPERPNSREPNPPGQHRGPRGRPAANPRTLALLLVLLALPAALTRPAYAADTEAARCDRSIPDIFAAASPAVVLITAQSVNPYRLQNRVSRVLGSGFIIQEDGVIMTNSHVVFGTQSITVTLDDGTVVPGRLVGADPIFDVAIVKIPKPDEGTLPVLRLGDSDRLRTGDEVIAIGNPLGLDQTVTRGIVSGLNRLLPETPLSLQEPLIQTDAPINPGNSGGPLLDHCGEVVGINSSIITDAQNIGFAIPSNLAKLLLPSLLKNGHVIRPWIGFHGQLIGADLRNLLQIPLVDGLLVEAIEPGSPADKAGIRGGRMELTVGGSSFLLGGDIVVSINGVKVTDAEGLASSMRGLKVGSRLKLEIFREGKYLDVEYDLPERPLLPGDVPSEGEQSLEFGDRNSPRRLSQPR